MRKTAKTLALILAAVMIIAMFPMTASAASSKPGKVTISKFSVSKVSKSTNTATVTIKWKKASRATGYWVYERQPDGTWKVLKKLGKRYGGIKIYKVFAGSRAYKVCAVRKVGKKTYLGTAAKRSKFITSPLNLEKLYKLVGTSTEVNSDPLFFNVKGNKITLQYRIPSGSDRPSDSDVNEFIESWKDDIKQDCKSARLNGGVKGTSGTVSVYLGDELLGQKTFNEYSK